MRVQHYTLVYLLHHFEKEGKTRVLYGMKKSKYCAGTWVGVGGKIHQGESILEGAFREISEEVPGVEVVHRSVAMRALLHVVDLDRNEERFVHTMVAYSRESLVPWGSSEFHHFGWWDIHLLPSPLPPEAIYWLPRALNLCTTPLCVEIAGANIETRPAPELQDEGYLFQQL